MGNLKKLQSNMPMLKKRKRRRQISLTNLRKKKSKL
jgi:hypothetical protein